MSRSFFSLVTLHMEPLKFWITFENLVHALRWGYNHSVAFLAPLLIAVMQSITIIFKSEPGGYFNNMTEVAVSRLRSGQVVWIVRERWFILNHGVRISLKIFHIVCSSQQLCTGVSCRVFSLMFWFKTHLLLVACLWVGPQRFLHCFTLLADYHWKGLLTEADWSELQLTIASHGTKKNIYL